MTEGRLATVLGAALALGAGTPPSLHAQSSLPEFAQQWAVDLSSRDLAAIADDLADRGIELSFRGEAHTGLGQAQARAALRRFLEGIPVGVALLERVEELGGQPARAYLQIRWEPDTGARPTEPFTMFVGVRWEGGAWRVSALRVLDSPTELSLLGP